MVIPDRNEQLSKVAEAMDLLVRAHRDVGGDIISGGGTGTYDLHDRLTEVQAGSYALMDTHYETLGLSFVKALWIETTVVSVNEQWAVCDAGLKSLGMDHGNPSIEGAKVWFCSDEHVTFAPEEPVQVGDRVRVWPAHIDPTVAMHDRMYLAQGGEVVDTWAIDLRGW